MGGGCGRELWQRGDWGRRGGRLHPGSQRERLPSCWFPLWLQTVCLNPMWPGTSQTFTSCRGHEGGAVGCSAGPSSCRAPRAPAVPRGSPPPVKALASEWVGCTLSPQPGRPAPHCPHLGTGTRVWASHQQVPQGSWPPGLSSLGWTVFLPGPSHPTPHLSFSQLQLSRALLLGSPKKALDPGTQEDGTGPWKRRNSAAKAMSEGRGLSSTATGTALRLGGPVPMGGHLSCGQADGQPSAPRVAGSGARVLEVPGGPSTEQHRVGHGSG